MQAPIRAYWDQSPYIRGTFARQPSGVILHGSRSGVENRARRQEFDGTRAWARNNPNGYAWHVTVGELEYSAHMELRQWGYHAAEHSDEYLGAEFAQPTIAYAITDEQITAFAHWFRTQVRVVWPGLDLRDSPAVRLPMHSEMAQGIRDGKSDAFLPHSSQAVELRTRVLMAVYG